MKISQVIESLNVMKEKYGDLPCMIRVSTYDEPTNLSIVEAVEHGFTEFNHDEGHKENNGPVEMIEILDY